MTASPAVARMELGCAWLGPPRSDPEPARATVGAALEHGVRTFDVAPLYNAGAAERCLADALREVPRDAVRISTKVGRLLRTAPDGRTDVVGDYTPSGVRRSLEESLERLGTDRVERVLLHDPQNAGDGGLAAYRELERMHDEGLTDTIGIGINDSAYAAPFLGACRVQTILLAGRWTLLDRSAAAGLLPRCRELGITVAAAGVFNTGVLADPEAPDATFDYAPVTAGVRDRARRIRTVCERHGVPLQAAALQFPFTDPVVSSVVVGASHPDQVGANADWLRRQVPTALWSDLRADGLL